MLKLSRNTRKSLNLREIQGNGWKREHLVGDIIVQAHDDDHGKPADHAGEGGVEPFGIGDLGREGDLVREEDVTHRQHRVLVEHIGDESGHPTVRAASVAEEQGHEEAELTDGHVAGLHGLVALLAADADAHVRALDHGHVVGAVADGQGDAAPAAKELRSSSCYRTGHTCQHITLKNYKLLF